MGIGGFGSHPPVAGSYVKVPVHTQLSRLGRLSVKPTPLQIQVQVSSALSMHSFRESREKEHSSRRQTNGARQDWASGAVGVQPI